MKPSLKTSLLKLILVGILFYTSYGFSNHYAASLDYVPEVAFAWERNIPFWAWTIVPYWSLNLMYAAAFFLCRDTHEQNRYVAHLVAAQLIATLCFVLFPLRFGWTKPPADGCILLGAFSQNPPAAFLMAKPDCFVGTDNLSTSFYRRTDRSIARLAGVVGFSASDGFAVKTGLESCTLTKDCAAVFTWRVFDGFTCTVRWRVAVGDMD